MTDAVTGLDRRARSLIGPAESVHVITYYSQEVQDWSDAGYRGWWHAYFGYRAAPLGPAPAGLVTSTFYNFAPRMVARAVPGVWAINSPADTSAIRVERVTRAMDRIFGSEPNDVFARAATLLRRAVADCSVAGRPLYGAYAELEWPTDDRVALWHGCTLVREHRFDGHNAALLAAEVDGVGCHVLMAANGRGNGATIRAIRGWTEDEWNLARRELEERGWLQGDGSLTDVGREARVEIERQTDLLADEPVRRLGSADLASLLDLLGPLAERLRAHGEVASTWPPPHLAKQDS